MRIEELDLTDIPQKKSFHTRMAKETYLLGMYNPSDIEKDIPFMDDWWKFLYWMPRIKKEFYELALKEPDFELALVEKCNSLGIDFWWFSKNYDFFIERLEWMRKNGSNHIGEVLND